MSGVRERGKKGAGPQVRGTRKGVAQCQEVLPGVVERESQPQRNRSRREETRWVIGHMWEISNRGRKMFLYANIFRDRGPFSDVFE